MPSRSHLSEGGGVVVLTTQCVRFKRGRDGDGLHLTCERVRRWWCELRAVVGNNASPSRVREREGWWWWAKEPLHLAFERGRGCWRAVARQQGPSISRSSEEGLVVGNKAPPSRIRAREGVVVSIEGRWLGNKAPPSHVRERSGGG